ncbi:MAG: efflux RND transporter periplasmic adaptor subunit [Luteitalea sp.]|nr:efflux RND transporter periplasmic adaptor subunit [Luteitalea sp.]
MNSESRVSVRWPVLVVAAAVLLALGAGAAYVGLRSRAPDRSPSNEQAAIPGARVPAAGPGTEQPASSPGASAPLPDVVVTLGQEAAERAGIAATTVSAGTTPGGVRAPGVVEANAYKQVVVTPVVSGRITRVTADLGQHVQRGQTLAQIFSPELADAQTRYISARAELEAHEQELARTEKLVAIGAASRQELERIHAGHTARRADVESAASRLQLLGLSADAIESLGPGKNQGATTNVPAPIGGVVIDRLANVGLNVDQATKLFTVVDLSSVWVVASLYEKDFALVRVGSPATITTNAYPDLALQGRVSYIDPQVSPETRTARVRIEVPNARNDLRLGMYAEAFLGGEGGSPAPMIPRGAVQNVGDRTVVYLVNPKEPGTFVEREVRLGMATGSRVSVLAGVRTGDVVVGEGSFSVRAERERLGLRAVPTSAQRTTGSTSDTQSGPKQGHPTVQDARVRVTERSFDPQRLMLRAGVPARLTFTRTSDKTCATAVVFESLNIRRELPLNVPVTIEFTPDKAGEIAFACGMNMLRGTVAVQ